MAKVKYSKQSCFNFSVICNWVDEEENRRFLKARNYLGTEILKGCIKSKYDCFVPLKIACNALK